MDFIEAEIQPKFREDATLYLDNERYKELFVDGTILVISEAFDQQFSFACRVTSMEMAGSSRLEVDQDLVGPLETGNRVKILPYKIQNAERIILLLKDSIWVPDGDWGLLLAEKFSGEILDFGNEFTFTYPSELNPMMVPSVLETSLPRPPVRLGNQTKVTVKKIREGQLDEAKIDGRQAKIDRVEKYREQLAMNAYALMNTIKGGEGAYEHKRYDFKAEYPAVVQGIKSIMQSWKIWDEKTHDLQGQEAVVSSAIDFILPSQPPKYMAEFRIHARGEQSNFDFTLYGSERKGVRKEFDRIENLIMGLAYGIEERIKAVSNDCSNCGAHGLEFDKADEKGLVLCEVCNYYNEIPLRYRTV